MKDLPFATSDKTQLVKRRDSPGDGNYEKNNICNQFGTIYASFNKVCDNYGQKIALHQKIGTEWKVWTWNQYRQNVDDFAKSLLSLEGFEELDVINIIGSNAPEWNFAYYGAIMAGGIAAGMYATNGPGACKYESKYSGAKLIVVDGEEQLKKYYGVAKDLPNLKAFVMYGADSVPDDAEDKLSKIPVYTFNNFLELGKKEKIKEKTPDELLKEIGGGQKPNQVAAFVFTSGTTGSPKAAMITHDNIRWTAGALMLTMKREIGQDDHVVSYLPLSHISAQIVDMHIPLVCGSQTWFAPPNALEEGYLKDTLKEVRPTVFFGVPGVWMKIYEKMQEISNGTKRFKKLGGWAMDKSTQKWENCQHGGNGNKPFLFRVARHMLKKARIELGLDRCFAFYVGSAPLPDTDNNTILKYFASINMPLLEVFGLTECTGPHLINKTKDKEWKMGTVGRSLPGTKSDIDDENGELICYGRNIFAGYLDMPDETAKAVDAKGYLRTGDMAKVDDHKFITITGRIKELIITIEGEKVAPVLIENTMKEVMPALSNCMVMGDTQNFLSIIFCLQVEIGDDRKPTNKLTGTALDISKEIGSTAKTTDEARNCEKWKKYFDDGMGAGNEMAISRAQRVKKWVLFESDFTERSGELTPTLKLKRSFIANKYQDLEKRVYQNNN